MKVNMFLCLAAICSISDAVTLATAPVTLSVCQLMADLRSYNGRVVVVRGQLTSGPEQFLLLAEGCPKHFVTDGYTWLDAVQVVAPYSAHAPDTLPFVPDVTAIDGFLKRVKDAEAKNGAARGCVTMVGLIQTRTDYGIRQTLQGPRPGRGFGHMGRLPAQIVLKTIGDVSIKPWWSGPTCSCSGEESANCR